MNKYARLAANYDQKFRPKAYRQNSESYYQSLGEQIQEQVLSLSMSLEGKDSPGEEYMQKVGRLNNAKMLAEEMTLEELVYSNPAELAADVEDLLSDFPINSWGLAKFWESVGTARVDPQEMISTDPNYYDENWTQDEKMIHEMDQLEWFQKFDWSAQHLEWKEKFLPKAQVRLQRNLDWEDYLPDYLELVAYWRINLDPQILQEYDIEAEVIVGALKQLRAFEELAQVPHQPYPNMSHHPLLAQLAIMPEPSSH